MVIMDLIRSSPIISIVVIALVVTLFSTLITKWLTNQEHMRSLKARQKELQADLKKHKDNPGKMQELQMEMMQIAGTMMKSSFKPLLITFLPLILLLYWLKATFTPLVGFSGWFWWYLGASLVSSMILRKVLKVA